MPVDVFGRTDFAKDSTRVISRGIDIQQANKVFLRRDGENAAESDINLDSHKLINVADPTDNKDAANKEYVDSNAGTNKVSKSGDTMTGHLLMSGPIGSEKVRVLGCTDLTPGKGFSLTLGNFQNQLQFERTIHEHEQTPVTLETTHGFLVQENNVDICQMGPRCTQTSK